LAARVKLGSSATADEELDLADVRETNASLLRPQAR
jgi:hypothetical protein